MLKINPFAETNKAFIDTQFSLADEGLQGVEQLSALNLQLLKTTLTEWAQGTQATLSAKSPAELANLQTAALQAAPQKAQAYGRQVKEIIAAATAAQRTVLEAQLADVQAKFLEAVQGTLKNLPGSENTVALVKSAVAAGNNAYDGMNKASKQVSDVVDANVTKIVETAASTSRSSPETIDA